LSETILICGKLGLFSWWILGEDAHFQANIGVFARADAHTAREMRQKFAKIHKS